MRAVAGQAAERSVLLGEENDQTFQFEPRIAVPIVDRQAFGESINPAADQQGIGQFFDGESFGGTGHGRGGKYTGDAIHSLVEACSQFQERADIHGQHGQQVGQCFGLRFQTVDDSAGALSVTGMDAFKKRIKVKT